MYKTKDTYSNLIEVDDYSIKECLGILKIRIIRHKQQHCFDIFSVKEKVVESCLGT